MTQDPQKVMAEVSDRLGALFGSTAAELLQDGKSVRFRAPGYSMHPLIRPSDVLQVAPVRPEALCIGDIALYRTGRRIIAHRVVASHPGKRDSDIIFKGDACTAPDPPVAAGQILGKVTAVERNGRHVDPYRLSRRLYSTAYRFLARLIRPFRIPIENVF